MDEQESVQRGADSGQAKPEKALEFAASFNRMLDLVVVGFATGDETIAVERVQVSIDWGRHAVELIKSQARQLAAAKAEIEKLRYAYNQLKTDTEQRIGAIKGELTDWMRALETWPEKKGGN